jgi:hypothetical protein
MTRLGVTDPDQVKPISCGLEYKFHLPLLICHQGVREKRSEMLRRIELGELVIVLVPPPMPVSVIHTD